MLWRMNQGSRQSGRIGVEGGRSRVPSLVLSGLSLLGILQAGCAGRSTPTAPTAPTALQQLQGTWSGIVVNGPPKERLTIRVAGDSFHFFRDTNFWFDTTITLPPGTDPQRLLAKIRKTAAGQEDSIDQSVVAIFKIEGETLILATRGGGPDDPPPTGFDIAEGRGLTRYELQRVQPSR